MGMLAAPLDSSHNALDCLTFAIVQPDDSYDSRNPRCLRNPAPLCPDRTALRILGTTLNARALIRTLIILLPRTVTVLLPAPAAYIK